MSHLEQLRQFGRGFVIRREDVVHVLLEALVIQLPPLLDLSRHLLFDLLNVFRRTVRVLKGFPGIE